MNVVLVPDTEREASVPTRLPVERVRRTPMAWVGIAAIALVLVVTLFVAFLLWGSGYAAARSQALLLQRFRQLLPTQTLDDPTKPLVPGQPVALLVIPKIGVDQVVLEGSTAADLMRGPGHLPASPVPGEYGNAVVMGRRVSFGAPFGDIAQLRPGDKVQVTTGQGAFRYVVDASYLTTANDPTPIAPSTQSRLTLITAGPAFGPSDRLVVTAKLDGPPVTVASRPFVLLRDGDLGGSDIPGGVIRVLWWSLLLGAGVFVSLRLYRRWPRRAAYALCMPVLVFFLWQVFMGAARMLPGVL